MSNYKWLKLGGLFLGIAIFQTSCLVKSPEEKIQSLIRSALRYEKEKKYEEALHKLNTAISMDSTQSFAFVFRGKIRNLLKQDSLAILDFSKAIKINPQNTSAYFHKGISYSFLSNEDSAIANFDYAILTKSSGEFYFNHSYSKFDDLEKQVDVAMSVIRYNRAISLYEMGKDTEAVKDFYYSLNHNYKIDDCRFYIGVILIRQDKKLEGCALLKQAMLNGDKEAIDFFSKYCE